MQSRLIAGGKPQRGRAVAEPLARDVGEGGDEPITEVALDTDLVVRLAAGVCHGIGGTAQPALSARDDAFADRVDGMVASADMRTSWSGRHRADARTVGHLAAPAVGPDGPDRRLGTSRDERTGPEG